MAMILFIPKYIVQHLQYLQISEIYLFNWEIIETLNPNV